MAALIKQYLCCCLPQSRSTPDQALQDERAPLLNPDILPSAPPRPTQRTTEQEQAERDQLRRILHLAEQRLLSVESLAPFRAVEPTPVATTTTSSSSDSNKKRSRSNRRKPRHDQPAPRSLSESSSSTLTLTPASPRHRRDTQDRVDEDSPSRHRRGGQSHSPSRVHPAAGDEGAGPLAPIRVVHLDRTTWTEIQVAGQNRKGGGSEIRRPGSSHSMKTLPSSRQGGKPPVGVAAAGLSGLSITTTTSSDHNDDDDDDDAAAEEEDFQDAEDGQGGRSSTRFGTVESYRTAREQGDDEDWSTTRSRDGGAFSTNGRRRHARDLWSQASGGKGTHEELAHAIEQLERDIDSWTLRPHGPFTADLGGGGDGELGGKE